MTLEITRTPHTHKLPTIPGKAAGITRWDETSVTLQCAACLDTLTGTWEPGETGTRGVFVLTSGWNFAPDSDTGRHVPYRRCPECRKNHKHPEPYKPSEPVTEDDK